MKFSPKAGSLLTGLLLIAAGCDTTETTNPESAKKVEAPAVSPGPASPTPPIVPSPVPSLPETTKPDTKAEEPRPEAKPEEKNVEPRLEPPK